MILPSRGISSPTSPLGIPAAVEALVVSQRDGCREAEQLALGVGEDLVADRRVALHLFALLGRQGAGLAKDLARGGDLSDVVHRSRHPQQMDLLGVETEVSSQEGGDLSHPVDVLPGGEVVKLDRLGESFDRLLARETQLVDRLLLGGRQLVAQRAARPSGR